MASCGSIGTPCDRCGEPIEMQLVMQVADEQPNPDVVQMDVRPDFDTFLHDMVDHAARCPLA